MSTRHARVANTFLNERHAIILKELLEQPENMCCADCGKKDPRWASWNLGIFVCIQCSGIHRSMGTHISKVKSVDLDTWVPEQIDSMIRWGNGRANKYWEAKSTPQDPRHNMEARIRAKYEHKQWASQDNLPDPESLGDGPIISRLSMPVPEEDTFGVTRPAVALPVAVSVAAPLAALSPTFSQLERPDIASFEKLLISFTPRDPKPLAIDSLAISTPSPTHQSRPKIYEDHGHGQYSGGSVDLRTSPTNRFGFDAQPLTRLPDFSSQGEDDLKMKKDYLTNRTSYLEQLSNLTIGMPSTGVIPQTPPGYKTTHQNAWILKDSLQRQV